MSPFIPSQTQNVWAVPSIYAKRAHYWRLGNRKSACANYVARDWIDFTPDIPEGITPCAMCARKAEKDKS